tara:strand:+ start:32432 stop:33274 length:843 start_codon:yes stop_codon:yes gene_type:complete
MPEDNTTFADRLNRTKEKMGELSKKAGEATKKATQATGDFLEKTSNQIQTAVEDTKSKIEEKREKRLQEKKEALIEEELMGDALSMDTLPFHNEELAQINQNQNEVISELTEHMIMLSNRVDQLQTQLNTMRGLIEEQENEEDKLEERKSSNPAISVLKILNTSLLTLVACLGIERYVEQEALMIADTYPVSFISWGIGAVIWSFFIMNSLSKNLNSVNLSKALKIQFALTIGFFGFLSMFFTENPGFTISSIWLWGTAIALMIILADSSLKSIKNKSKN